MQSADQNGAAQYGDQRSHAHCHRWLQDAFEAAPPGAERIVMISRNNIHRGFEVIVKRASLTPWDDL